MTSAAPSGSTGRLGLAVGAGVASIACGIGLLATSGWLITRASLRPPVFVLSVAIGAVQAFALGRGLARYVQRLAVHDLSLEVLGRVRLRLYDALEPLVPGALWERSTGSIVSGFVSDAELVAQGVAKKVTTATDVWASIVLGAVVACLVRPGVGAVLLAGALGTAGVTWVLSRAARSAAAEEVATGAALADVIVETVRGAPELVAFGREDIVTEALVAVRERSSSAARRRALATGVARAAGIWITGATLAAVVATGLAAHDAHRLSGVMLAVVVFVALAVLDQCAALPVALAGVDASDAAGRRLCALAEIDPPAHEPVVDHGPPPGHLPVRFEDVEVVTQGTPRLAGVSFDVSPGRRLALVGPSGSGKTSALHALLHFVDCARGQVTIGGVEVSEMTRQGIARHLGWVAEDTHLFATSLRDNLRLANPAATDDRCQEVLRRVGLSRWYTSLADGLDTVLGAGGRPLSAGERQRMGLARVLLIDGDALLLDEPTAHLDPASSAGVLSEILDARGERCALVVSHDPGIDRFVDQIVTLGEGRVVGRREVGRQSAGPD